MINEFKTSELCSKCENPLENYKGIHRVLVSRNYKCNGCESKRIIFINRHMNACMNMINISKSFINSRNRPINFCRENNELIINNQTLLMGKPLINLLILLSVIAQIF